MDEPFIKLFLSVDISGSTKLKNTNNYFQIQKFCEEYVKIEKNLNEENPSVKTHTGEEVYKHICDNEAHQDWSIIIEKCLEDFHQNFNSRLNTKADPGFKSEIPWKMAGDELIYCIDVENRRKVHDYLLSFFETLRYFDKQYFDKGSFIRVKGAAWTVGFPIRNRRMTPIKYPEHSGDSSQSQLMEDYMGPEIDIGFRIGKHTFPGLIVVSLELAYILNDTKLQISPEKRLRVIDTGWEELKGVWEGNKYPIFWLALPKEYYSGDLSEDKDKESIKYEPYKKWEIEKDSHVANYHKKINLTDGSGLETKKSLDELIDSLPASFDVIRPYFIKEDSDLPPEHKNRADFIKKIEEYNKKNENQNNLPKMKKKEPTQSNLTESEVDKLIDFAAGALKLYIKSKTKK